MKSGRPPVLTSVLGTRRAPARKGLQATRIKAKRAVRPGVEANPEQLQVTDPDLHLLAGPGVDLSGPALHPGQEVTPEVVAGGATVATDRGRGAGLTAAIEVIAEPTAGAAQEVSLTSVNAEDPGAGRTHMTAMTVAAGAEAPPTTDRAATAAGPGVAGPRTAAVIAVTAIAGATVGGVKRLIVVGHAQNLRTPRLLFVLHPYCENGGRITSEASGQCTGRYRKTSCSSRHGVGNNNLIRAGMTPVLFT